MLTPIYAASSYCRYSLHEEAMDANCKCCSLLFLLLSGLLFPVSSSSIGINYGQIANNLLAPEKVAGLLQSIGVKKVKLYDTDAHVLRAFANTGVEFVVGLSNECVGRMTDSATAIAWVKANVQAYLPETRITCITIGNEVFTSNDTDLMENLLPAMQNIHTALVTLGLDKQVNITTAHSLAILENSYPPSGGSFRRDLSEFLPGILNFHSKTGSPFLINAYPYFAYKSNPKQVALDYVLFQPNQGIFDPFSKLCYDNMLFAQMDAVHSALAAEGYPHLPVQISETGWPSKGDADEAGATPENARKYNGNLLNLISQKKGTPMKPSAALNIYVFALFNENLKPGPTSERNYGLFKPDGTPAYTISLTNGAAQPNSGNKSTGQGPATTPTTNTGQGSASISNGPIPDSSLPTDLTFSSARELRLGIAVFYLYCACLLLLL